MKLTQFEQNRLAELQSNSSLDFAGKIELEILTDKLNRAESLIDLITEIVKPMYDAMVAEMAEAADFISFEDFVDEIAFEIEMADEKN